MGSTDKAVITGFICRLCSKMNRFVIHIYGEEGERMRLAEKINAYLPITINVNDPLPKTVCLPCIDRLEAHHELMEQFTWARQRLAEAKAAEIYKNQLILVKPGMAVVSFLAAVRLPKSRIHLKWTLEHTSRTETPKTCFRCTIGPKCSKYIPSLRTG